MNETTKKRGYPDWIVSATPEERVALEYIRAIALSENTMHTAERFGTLWRLYGEVAVSWLKRRLSDISDNMHEYVGRLMEIGVVRKTERGVYAACEPMAITARTRIWLAEVIVARMSLAGEMEMDAIDVHPLGFPFGTRIGLKLSDFRDLDGASIHYNGSGDPIIEFSWK